MAVVAVKEKADFPKCESCNKSRVTKDCPLARCKSCCKKSKMGAQCDVHGLRLRSQGEASADKKKVGQKVRKETEQSDDSASEGSGSSDDSSDIASVLDAIDAAQQGGGAAGSTTAAQQPGPQCAWFPLVPNVTVPSAVAVSYRATVCDAVMLAAPRDPVADLRAALVDVLRTAHAGDWESVSALAEGVVNDLVSESVGIPAAALAQCLGVAQPSSTPLSTTTTFLTTPPPASPLLQLPSAQKEFYLHAVTGKAVTVGVALLKFAAMRGALLAAAGDARYTAVTVNAAGAGGAQSARLAVILKLQRTVDAPSVRSLCVPAQMRFADRTRAAWWGCLWAFQASAVDYEAQRARVEAVLATLESHVAEALVGQTNTSLGALRNDSPRFEAVIDQLFAGASFRQRQHDSAGRVGKDGSARVASLPPATTGTTAFVPATASRAPQRRQRLGKPRVASAPLAAQATEGGAGGKGAIKRCYVCGGEGHLQATCPKRRLQ